MSSTLVAIYNRPMKQPRVALIHDYLTQFGGAEETLKAITELYPDAPIYTGIYKTQNTPEFLKKKTIISAKGFFFETFSKYFTWLMPFVFEGFDLRNYDLIISDGTAWPKGVLTTPDQLHIAYIHTPPRFLYGYSVESTKRNAWYFKPAVTIIDHYLRIWDFNAAQRPNFLLANSKEVQRRIQKFYKRDAKVINPPVEINIPKSDVTEGQYYLAIGRLVAYKNFDLLIKAFNKTGLNLTIVGTGPEEKKLKRASGKNIKFAGRVSDNEKHKLLRNALGVINIVSNEDFGIVPIEAFAHGKPVLAHKSGGHLETVKENVNGMFIEDLSVKSLVTKIKEFDTTIREEKFDSKKIKEGAKEYSKERFKKEFKDFVDKKWEEFLQTRQK